MHRSHLRHILFAAMLAVTAGCLDEHLVNTNEPPRANAGADQQLDWDGDPVAVRLDGRKSSDPNGSVAAYLWRSGDDGPDGGAPGAALDPEDVARPELELDRGSYTFVLWVRDDDGAVSEPDRVTVRVGTDPVAECEGGLPEQFQNDCGSCVCGASEACRSAAAVCDDACWELIGCIASNCLEATDISCVTSECAAFLGGATGAMSFANAGCLEPCTEACLAAAGGPDAG